jgi:hypothetical protein
MGETWRLTLRGEQRLKEHENRILRKISLGYLRGTKNKESG